MSLNSKFKGPVSSLIAAVDHGPPQPGTVMSSTTGSITKTLVKSGATGAIGAGGSYMLGRRNYVNVLGLQQREWVVDGVALAAESLVGDAVGNYAIPKIEGMISPQNDTLRSFTKYAAPPTIVGLEVRTMHFVMLF